MLESVYASVILPIAYIRHVSSLTYKVSSEIAVGDVVFAPFGKKLYRGVVIETMSATTLDESKIREIKGVDQKLTFTRERLEWAKWLANYYQAHLLDVLRLFLPGEIWQHGVINATHEIVEICKTPTGLEIEKLHRAPKQSAAYEQLNPGQIYPLTVLTNSLRIERSILKALEKRGLLKITIEPVTIPDLAMAEPSMILTAEQSTALEGALRGNGFRPSLLFGVTGSGKTEIYLQAIARILAQGKSALFLVPEIALTPQTIARIEKRFPGLVAVVHSSLTDHQRALAWSRASVGQARIMVGPRSALFAPLQNLGLIVIDEEHETSYKQESAPRYQTRDTALWLAKKLDIPLILGSATPSVESYAAAIKHDYRLLKLPSRISGQIPSIDIVDLREERKAKNYSIISEPLRIALQETLAAKRQSILFLNRRGYSPTLHCLDCGEVAGCPDCSLTMTLHRRRQRDQFGQETIGQILLCHGCGNMRPSPTHCPNCHSAELHSFGYGTQRVQHELEIMFPGIRIARADRDTTRGARAHGEIYEKVLRHEVDILIGTQMIAKGLDLPAVDLVGILLADIGLARPDFRATEQAFGLLTQVSGRAGRRDQNGRVILQTYNPEATAIQATVSQDVTGFLESELLLRQAFKYPPYSALAKLSFSQAKAIDAYQAMNNLAEILQPLGEKCAVEVRGPVPAAIPKRQGQYTYNIILKGNNRTSLSPLLKDLPPGVQVDIDPLSIS